MPHWIPIIGSSMRPFLDSGDLVGVAFERDSNPTLGDLILGKSDDLWIVHRVIGYKKNNSEKKKYITKGDSSFACEELSRDEIWGRIVAWKKAGTDNPVVYKKTALDVGIALLAKSGFRKFAKILSLLKRNIVWI